MKAITIALISRLEDLEKEGISLEEVQATRFLRLGLDTLATSRKYDYYMRKSRGTAMNAFRYFEEWLVEAGITFPQFAEIVGDKMITESEYEAMKVEATTK